jgi:hypothetical protein
VADPSGSTEPGAGRGGNGARGASGTGAGSGADAGSDAGASGARSGEVEETTVWRAPRGLRIFATVVLVVFALLTVRVAIAWGFLATIGIILVVGVMAQVWWQLLRPKLTAGPDGVDVVSDRHPVHLDWSQVRRAEPGPKGLTIICADGRAIQSRVPHAAKPASAKPASAKPASAKPASAKPTATKSGAGEPARGELELAADYLTRRAAWARKSAGPRPRYEAPVTTRV